MRISYIVVWGFLVIMLIVLLTNRKDYEPFLADVVFAGDVVSVLSLIIRRAVIPHLMRNPDRSTILDSYLHRKDNRENQSFVEYFQIFLNIFECFRTFSNVFARFCQLHKKAIVMALWTKAGLCGESSLSEQCLPRTPSWLKTLCNLWNPWLIIYFWLLSSNFVSWCLCGYQKSIKCAGIFREKSRNPKFF